MKRKSNVLVRFEIWMSLVSISVLSLIVNSCNNTIDPLDEETGQYSIYGALDVRSDFNYIRVRDLNTPILQGIIYPMDATVTLQNLETLELEVLRDTLSEFEGVYVWNFESSLSLEYNSEYLLKVEGSDGEKVTTTTKTPNLAEVTVFSDMPDCTTGVEVRVGPVETGNLEIEMGFEWRGQMYWGLIRPSLILGEDVSEFIEIQLTPRQISTEALNDQIGIPCHLWPDPRIHYRFTHYGPDFSENTISDTLTIPGGAGNFGAYYIDSGSFPIDDSEIIL